MGRGRSDGSGDGGARSLKTAALALRALRLLGSRPDGMTAATLGAALGKSAATARYMINTLCEAGFAERHEDSGVYRLAPTPPWGCWPPAQAASRTVVPAAAPLAAVAGESFAPGAGSMPAASSAVLGQALTELYRRTRQRAYLVEALDDGTAALVDTRGHQGLARLPGLESVIEADVAHCWAPTKILLAERAIEPAAEPVPCTTRSIADQTRLVAQLRDVRIRGWAVDEQEFVDGFCGVAARVTSPWGAHAVAIAVSVSSRQYTARRDELIASVVEVAAAAQDEWVAEPAPPSRRPTPVSPNAWSRR